MELFKLSANGKIQTWSIAVVETELVITYGQQGGKMRVVRRACKTAKQAETQAAARRKKKIEEGFSTTLGEVSVGVRWAMLAADYKDNSDLIEYPCFVQPKFDGERFKYENGRFISRGGHEKRFDHLLQELKEMKDVALDGEMFLPSFETLCSKIARNDTAGIQFIVFDCVSSEEYKERLEFLSTRLSSTADGVRLIETHIANSPTDVDRLFSMYSQTHEGIVIRNFKGLYRAVTRSKDMLKRKLVQDAEFKIVGFKRAQGDRIVWRCETAEGCEFSVRPACTDEEGKEMLQRAGMYIGCYLTVSFQNKTKNGIPRFPVGKAVRGVEEFEG
jgi:DNA ligase-1